MIDIRGYACANTAHKVYLIRNITLMRKGWVGEVFNNVMYSVGDGGTFFTVLEYCTEI